MSARARRTTRVRRAPRRRGLTLVEVMVALIITSMVGAAVAAMLDSVSYATTTRTSAQRANVKQKVIGARIDVATRSSTMVLAHDEGILVLWLGDSRVNGRPNLSELRRIEWNGATSEIWSYRAPTGLSIAADTLYELTADFEAVTAGLIGTPDFPGERWGTSVIGWAPTLDAGAAPDATLVQYDLVIVGEDVTVTLPHTASLRRRNS